MSQRRGDYAVLKALGFARRQVAGDVLWQSTVVVALALAVALPLAPPSAGGRGGPSPSSSA